MENSQNSRPPNAHLSSHSLFQGHNPPLPARNGVPRVADSLGNMPAYAPPSSSPVSIPPEAYSYLMQALLSMQNSLSMPATSGFPANFPAVSPVNPQPPASWSSSVSPTSDQQQPSPQSYSPTQFSFSQSSLDRPSDCPSDLSFLPPRPPTGGASSEPDAADDEARAIAEDKRRRNTAASARFRIKKKQWNLNLERTVADLSGRAEELEREAAELRKENSWLKEIVLLRGKALNAAATSTEGDNAAAAETSHTKAGEEESGDEERQQEQPHKNNERQVKDGS